MNIKLESEPLEVECNPFNYSSTGGTTGKKRRKKKDKEKKVRPSLRKQCIFRIEINFIYFNFLNANYLTFSSFCSNGVRHISVKSVQRYLSTEIVSITIKRKKVHVLAYQLLPNHISILVIDITVSIKTACQKE